MVAGDSAQLGGKGEGEGVICGLLGEYWSWRWGRSWRVLGWVGGDYERRAAHVR